MEDFGNNLLKTELWDDLWKILETICLKLSFGMIYGRFWKQFAFLAAKSEKTEIIHY